MGKKEEKERPDIMDAAVRYISVCMRSEGEVIKHLKKKGYSEEEIFPAVQQMKDLNYLDDEEFCRVAMEKSMKKGHGINRIRSEMQQKWGIAADIIDRVAEDICISETERQRAMKMAEKVLSGKEPDEKMKARIGRRLSYYGYSTDTVYWVLNNLNMLRQEDTYE